MKKKQWTTTKYNSQQQQNITWNKKKKEQTNNTLCQLTFIWSKLKRTIWGEMINKFLFSNIVPQPLHMHAAGQIGAER